MKRIRRNINQWLYRIKSHHAVVNYVAKKTVKRMDNDDVLMAKFYSQFIKPGDLVFDVGANMGNRTKIFLYLKANVVAFEPQKRCADFLLSAFKGKPQFSLVNKALGQTEGSAIMHISNSSTISSFSEEWIKATKKSGRFSQYHWDERETVKVTTLDQVIGKHGKPAFAKIDVEGFESEVLSGLSQPIRCMSLEFTPEYIENTHKCIDYVVGLAAAPEFQLTIGEASCFHLSSWVDATTIKKELASLDPDLFGDVYIRCL